MHAIDPTFLLALKKQLNERYVPHLPALLGKHVGEVLLKKQLSRAFAAFVLHRRLGIKPQTAAASVVDDYGDRGLDAIYYDEGARTLHLIQTKLRESEPFQQEDAYAFCDGIRRLLKHDFDSFNAHVKARAVQLENALDSCSHIKLTVAFVGNGISQAATEALDQLTGDEDLAEERFVKRIDLFPAEAVVAELRAEQSYAQVDAKLGLHQHSKVEEPRTTYFGLIRLQDLVDLHVKYGKALYDRNIRFYLGTTRSDVNKAIMNTLKERPRDFFYLNNGVTAVCDTVDPKAKKAGEQRLEVRGLSIINGAQTVATAAEFAGQAGSAGIDGARVMFTLIRAKADGEFGRTVTRARNHQNPFDQSSFAALDDAQERMRQDMALLGFDYRYRPETFIVEGGLLITLEEVIRALAVIHKDPRYAVRLKGDAPSLMDPYGPTYKELLATAPPVVQIVSAVQCVRVIRRVIASAEKSAYGQERLIYRHGVHCTTAIMMKRLLNRLKAAAEPIGESELAAVISAPLDTLRQQVADRFKAMALLRGPLAFFRNQSDAIELQVSVMTQNFALQADPAIEAIKKTSGSSELFPRQKLVEYLLSRAPQV